MLSIFSGHEFRRHLKEALEMRKKHTQLFEQFTATFQPNTIVSWEKLINTWKKDRSQPNPYLEPSPCKSRVVIMLYILFDHGYKPQHCRMCDSN
jgi:hypothetical protein